MGRWLALARCVAGLAGVGAPHAQRVISFHGAFEKRVSAMCTHAAQAREPGPRARVCPGRGGEFCLCLVRFRSAWKAEAIARSRAIWGWDVIDMLGCDCAWGPRSGLGCELVAREGTGAAAGTASGTQ